MTATISSRQTVRMLERLTPPTKYIVGAASVIGGGLLCYATYRFLRSRLKNVLETSPNKNQNVYESEKLLNEYLTFHYGGPAVNCVQETGPKNGFEFPARCSDLCIKYFDRTDCLPEKALDVGCAVGRSTFELAHTFKQVVGIDFSYGFIRTCNALQKNGQIEYEALIEGDLTSKHIAMIPSHVDPERCVFKQGDACNLPLDIGQFSCVLAANVLCRLPDPKVLLLRLSNLIVPGGICVITSPYTFLREYTHKAKWLGGYKDLGGKEVRAFDALKQILRPDFELIAMEDMPFLMRETCRKYQWAVAQATVWKRRKQVQQSV